MERASLQPGYRTPRLLLGLSLASAAVLLTACQSHEARSLDANPTAEAPRPESQLAARGELVIPGEAVAMHEASIDGSLPYERFEYGRRNALLSLVVPQPLLATNQWPEPEKPRERRVRFFYWRQ